MQVRVEWLGRSGYEADELVAPPRQGSGEAWQECGRWLRERLAGGVEVARSVLLEEAEAQGWTESTFKRACLDEKVRSTREGQFQGGTLLSLES